MTARRDEETTMSTDEYVPSEDDMRWQYVVKRMHDGATRTHAEQEYRRWLTAHDARVRRDAAREALDGLVPMLLARRPQCPALDGDGVIGYQCGLEQGHGGRHEILPGEFRDWYSIPEYRDARYSEETP